MTSHISYCEVGFHAAANSQTTWNVELAFSEKSFFEAWNISS